MPVKERASALSGGLDFLDAELDESKNASSTGGDDLSKESSKVRIFVVVTNEGIIVARKAKLLSEQ